VHILFLADASSVHSYRWIKYFSERSGIKITWCSLTKNTMPEIKNVEFKLLSKSNPLGLFRAIRYISKRSPDIIHAHYLGWNGFLSLFFPKTNVILTAWGSDIVFNRKNRIKRFLLERMITQSKVVTCDAHHLQDKMVELEAPREKIRLVMFGIDESLFRSKRQPFDVRAPNTKFTIGSIRNLHPVYDLITLLKAAKIILQKRSDVVFQIAGSGPDLKLLEGFVDKHKLNKDVNFVGRLESADLCNFYDGLDVYVSTALSDGGIASSTAEAMLCERPVVITDVAENGHWITDGENGRMFDCYDSINLANIILSLLDNQDIGIELGLKGKETIILRNTYNNEMEKMLKIYEQVA